MYGRRMLAAEIVWPEMLDSLTDRNKDVSIGLYTTYSERYDDTSQSSPYWEYRRFRAKTYSYKGLTAEAAAAGVAAKVAQYTRTAYNWRWMDERWVVDKQHPLGVLVAKIVPRRAGGHQWTVEIDVNEEVAVYSATRLSAASRDALFLSTFGTWDYDE